MRHPDASCGTIACDRKAVDETDLRREHVAIRQRREAQLRGPVTLELRGDAHRGGSERASACCVAPLRDEIVLYAVDAETVEPTLSHQCPQVAQQLRREGRRELEHDLAAIEVHEQRARRIEPSPFIDTGSREDLDHGHRRRRWGRRLLPRSDRGRDEPEDDRKRCGCQATGAGGGVRGGPTLSVHATILGPVERGRDIA